MISKKLCGAVLASTLVGVLFAGCSSPSASASAGGGGGGGKTSETASSGGDSAAQAAAKSMGIDLSKCPTDITKPLTGTIKVGTTIGLTGPVAAAFTFVGTAEKAAIESLNATSGLPVKFSLTQVDDQFAPDKALAGTQQLIQQDKVDLLAGTIGSANIAAARTVAEQNCVPLLAANAGAVEANEVSKFPFTSAWSLPSYIDTKVWVQDLKQKYPNGAKVALYTANSDTGKAYVQALNDGFQGTNIKIVSSTTIEVADSASPSSQVTTMKASGADVLLAAPSPSGQCSAMAKEVAGQGWKPKSFYITSQCSTLQLMAPAGKAAQGILCDLYLNDPSLTTGASDGGLQTIVAAIKKVYPGQPVTGSSLAGWSAMELLFKAAAQAQKSPLGLSRLGILYAATHIKFATSTMLPGIEYSLNYPSDEVAMEAAQLSSFNSSSNQWEKVKLFNFDGQTTGKASS